jgi:hypothetical protein
VYQKGILVDEIREEDEIAVYGAPGYKDGLLGKVLLFAAEVDGRGRLAVISDHSGEMHVIPAKYLVKVV